MSPTPQTPPTDRPLTAGDDWIEWHGGENPVPGQRVQLRWRDGKTWEFNADDAANVDWLHRELMPNSDIIAYRLVRPATSAASEGADYTSPCGYEAKLIDGQWRVGMAGNLDCIHDAEITVHKHVSDEWSETLAKRIAAALTTREEAPAELMDAGLETWLTARDLMPHGSWDWPSIVAMLDHHEDALTIPKAPAEGALIGQIEALLAIQNPSHPVPGLARQLLNRAVTALRNRTSEPEAGAVAWRFPSVLQPGLMMFTDAPPKDPNSAEPLYLHPAPATADKLRVAKVAKEAKEALETFAAQRINGEDNSSEIVPNGYSSADKWRENVLRARQALAALNEQPQ